MMEKRERSRLMRLREGINEEQYYQAAKEVYYKAIEAINALWYLVRHTDRGKSSPEFKRLYTAINRLEYIDLRIEGMLRAIKPELAWRWMDDKERQQKAKKIWEKYRDKVNKEILIKQEKAQKRRIRGDG